MANLNDPQMRITDNYILFWNGVFSQWYPSNFIVDGIKFSSCEQYMMYQKALTFKDAEIAEQILKESHPAPIKMLGRKVKNFDLNVWNSVCFGIVVKGNLAKFSQNPEMLKYLLNTGGKILVEASPQDKIWGIGLSASSPQCDNAALWSGTNLLGFALCCVRIQLLNQNLSKISL